MPRILLNALVLTVTLTFVAASFAATERRIVLDDCVVGGCSNQLCSEATAEPIASTCEYIPHYACYATYGECKRQTNGKCGWTPSTALAACMLHPPKQPGTGLKPFVTPAPAAAQ